MSLLTSVEAAAGFLTTGSVLLLPTDTLPGLHCRGDSAQAVARMRDLKGRPPEKPFLLLVDSVAGAEPLVGPVERCVWKLVADCWPGPFSFIFPGSGASPPELLGAGGTVALRMPDHRELRRLLGLVGCPLASTSANLAGEPPCRTWPDAVHRFRDRADGILDPVPDGWSPPSGRASAVVDLTVWPPVLLREGSSRLPRVV